MTDDGRLEIDEHGRVVDAAGGPVPGTLLDLADPEAAEELRPNPVQRWVDTRAAPYVSRHRTGLRVTSAVAIAGLAATAWWTSRPPYVPPTFDVALANAVLEGNSIGGPEISPAGQLSVAFVARGRTPGETVSITGLRGPGLRDVTATGAPVTSDVEQRVGITARVDCTDPSLQTAGATSYTLAAAGSQTGADPEAGTVPLATAGSRPITSLDKAITDWGLAALAPAAVTNGTWRATAVPGTPPAALSVEGAHTSPQTPTHHPTTQPRAPWQRVRRWQRREWRRRRPRPTLNRITAPRQVQSCRGAGVPVGPVGPGRDRRWGRYRIAVWHRRTRSSPMTPPLM